MAVALFAAGATGATAKTINGTQSDSARIANTLAGPAPTRKTSLAAHKHSHAKSNQRTSLQTSPMANHGYPPGR